MALRFGSVLDLLQYRAAAVWDCTDLAPEVSQ